MKNLFTVLGLFLFQLAFPQTVVITTNTGSRVSYDATEVTSIEFIEKTSPSDGGGSGSTDVANGHEYVDLGLPSGTKWATMNIGAEKKEDVGLFFAWGEVDAKDSFGLGAYHYKFYAESNEIKTDAEGFETEVTYSGFTKYVSKSGYKGYSDNKTHLEPEDDAANVNWGGNWRVPTKEQWEELIDKCTVTYVTSNGVGGNKVVGPNGNYLFIPTDSNQYWSETQTTFYWSSDLKDDGTAWVTNVLTVFGSKTGWPNAGYRAYGRLIRPVLP